MTIALIANDTTYVYNLRLETILALLEQGHRVVAVCERATHAEELEGLGIELINCSVGRHGKNPLKDLSLLSFYKKTLKALKPDIALTFNIKPNVYSGLVCHKLKIPFLVNITGLGTAVEYPGLMQKLTVTLYRMSIKHADCVFFQNEENKQFFDNHKIRYKKSVLLPGSGVNVSKFLPVEYPEDKQFCFISRILKQKGVEQYVEAAREVRKSHPDAIFHVIGSCDDANYNSYLAKAQDDGAIIYHGHSHNVKDFIKQCCCTVHPTYYPEGMSNVLLESAAVARPIITTDRSGCREIIDEGVNGFIVRQKDTAHLIERLNAFLSLDRETRKNMGLAGRAKVEKEFDRNIVVEKYLIEINEVFNEK